MGECNPLPNRDFSSSPPRSHVFSVQAYLLPTDLPSAVLAVLIIKIRINTQYSQAQAVLSDPGANPSDKWYVLCATTVAGRGGTTFIRPASTGTNSVCVCACVCICPGCAVRGLQGTGGAS